MDKMKFSAYAHYKVSERALKDIEPSSVVDKDEFEKIIFAPDPVTGFASSDMALRLSGDASPEVKEYVLSRLSQRNAPSVGFDEDKADEALSMSKSVFESRSDYFNRLRTDISEFVAKSKQSKE